eukprot:2880588-Lingulodinium_polyedra.AAC.1
MAIVFFIAGHGCMEWMDVDAWMAKKATAVAMDATAMAMAMNGGDGGFDGWTAMDGRWMAKATTTLTSGLI